MKMVITIVAFAVSAIAAPAFAKTQPNLSAAVATQHINTNPSNGTLGWVRDHAKGYVG